MTILIVCISLNSVQKFLGVVDMCHLLLITNWDIKEDSGRKADEMVRQLVCVGLRDGLAPDP